MSKSKTKGTSFESDCVEYMQRRLGDDRIERRALNGVKDRGDVSGVYVRGRRCVVECKNHARAELAAWVDEALEEKGNDGAEFAVVMHKRKGCGKKGFGKTYVTMTLDDFLAIIAGGHEYLED